MPSPADAAELQALLEEAEAARKDAELTWGAERLPLLIGTEWRVKLRRQQARMSEALQTAWAAERVTGEQIDDVRTKVAAMTRGWAKVQEIAAEAGHRPLTVQVLAERILPDGSVCVVVRDNDAAALVNATGRQASVWTLDEVFNVIGSFIPDVFQQAKIHFPGAVFTGARLDDGPEWDVRVGDAIPFGDPAPPPNTFGDRL